MQNKPNLLDAQMNVSSFLTKDYERNDIFAVPENKANSNPIPQRDTQYAIRDTRYKPNQTQPVVSLPAVPVLSLPKGARSNRRTYFKPDDWLYSINKTMVLDNEQ